jgi:hypothetical protein
VLDFIMFSLPDEDVFAIDALADPLALRTGSGRSFSGVGTVLYNLAVNPVHRQPLLPNPGGFPDSEEGLPPRDAGGRRGAVHRGDVPPRPRRAPQGARRREIARDARDLAYAV